MCNIICIVVIAVYYEVTKGYKMKQLTVIISEIDLLSSDKATMLMWTLKTGALKQLKEYLKALEKEGLAFQCTDGE